MAIELTNEQLISLAGDVLDIEARAVARLRERLGDNFVAACQLCIDTPGRIVVAGMDCMIMYQPSGVGLYRRRLLIQDWWLQRATMLDNQLLQQDARVLYQQQWLL